MADPRLDVLYEDNHLLVVNKPALLPTMGVAEGERSLLTVAKQYVRRKYNKPGNVYLGVVSRLDSMVTGVVVFARTSKAAARLTEQFRSGDVDKIYWAIVAGTPRPVAANCEDWLRKDEARHRMVVSRAGETAAKLARLKYRTLEELDETSFLEVQLETGRKHQIRVQLAHRGHPVLGDRKYGSRASFPRGIALHSQRLSLTHPVRQTRLDFLAPLPDAWKSLGIRAE
jgi:23S rRNA pseudouridine1911/1915/1917 synthase